MRPIRHLAPARFGDTGSAPGSTEIWPSARPISPRTILAETARYFDLSIPELTGPSTQRSLVNARFVAIGLIRELTELSLAEIALRFGGRDHTAILHAVRRVRDLPAGHIWRRQIEELRSLIRRRHELLSTEERP